MNRLLFLLLTVYSTSAKQAPLHHFVFCLVLNLANGAVKWPNINTSAELQRKSDKCQQAECILEWFQDRKSQISELHKSNCSQSWEKRTLNQLIEFNNEQLSAEFIKTQYGYNQMKNCDMCLNPVSAYIRFINLLLEQANVRIEGQFCYTPWTKPFCLWLGRRVRFNIYFSLFAIPLVLVVNVINLSTLSILISKHETSVAFRLHRAEIIADVVLNWFALLSNNLYVFDGLDQWISGCMFDISRYISLYHLFYTFSRFLTLLNQCCVLNLISDRLLALEHPFSYYGNAHRYRTLAHKLIVRTLYGSFLLYIPGFLFYSFMPLLKYWASMNAVWKMTMSYMDSVLSLVYALAPLICVMLQIIRGRRYEKAYGAFQRGTPKNRQDGNKLVRRKRDEQEKRALLIGTIGLNTLTSCVNMVLAVFKNRTVQNMLTDNRHSLWWKEVIYIVDPLLNFLNGTASFLMYVIFLKSYRKAFRKTALGSCIFKENQVTHVSVPVGSHQA